MPKKTQLWSRDDARERLKSSLATKAVCNIHAEPAHNHILWDTFKFVWIQLHHILVLNRVRLVDKLCDDSIILGKPFPNGEPGPNLYCAVIVKTVDERTRAKTGINELLREF